MRAHNIRVFSLTLQEWQQKNYWVRLKDSIHGTISWEFWNKKKCQIEQRLVIWRRQCIKCITVQTLNVTEAAQGERLGYNDESKHFSWEGYHCRPRPSNDVKWIQNNAISKLHGKSTPSEYVMFVCMSRYEYNMLSITAKNFF